MKISASIYSDKKRPILEVLKDLEDHQVDLIHVDCNDDPSCFDDIALIRQHSKLPIDLHLITSNPSKYYDLLRQNPVEYLTFQHEDLDSRLQIPSDITGKKGIAVITPTPISIFKDYESFDFILIMATIPGQSGGMFDKINFTKIRDFQKMYPQKAIHVDGGVNGEVSFILRNLGVRSSVSGSYLFNAPSIGQALLNLTKRSIDSHYLVSDFMTPISESPVILDSNLNFKSVLETIENGKVGFCVVVSNNNEFKGIISNADIRKGLLKNADDLNHFEVQFCINTNPSKLEPSVNVTDLLQFVRHSSFPITYLPIVDKGNKAVGIVTFVNLIKGEL